MNGRRFRRPFGRTVGVSTDDSRWCFACVHLPAATVWCGLVCETWSLSLFLSTVSTRGASDFSKIAQGGDQGSGIWDRGSGMGQESCGGQAVNRELGSGHGKLRTRASVTSKSMSTVERLTP